MKTFKLYKSTRKDKKYMVINVETGHKIHFGAKGHGDYIKYNKINKNLANQKRSQYYARHSQLPNEDWNNVNTAAFFAKHLLWNKPTFKGSIDDIKQKFNIKIIKCF